MKIWRKGDTARQWSDDPSKGKLTAAPSRYFTLLFWMPSKGGGITDVMVQYEPSDFGLLLKAMAIADEAAMLRAIGEVLVARKAQATAPVKPPVVGFQSTSPPAPVAQAASQ